MKETKIKIALPSEMTINIPSFSDLGLEDMVEILSTRGVEMIKREIEHRVLRAFVEEHEAYIHREVENLIEKKRGEIKKLLNS